MYSSVDNLRGVSFLDDTAEETELLKSEKERDGKEEDSILHLHCFAQAEFAHVQQVLFTSANHSRDLGAIKRSDKLFIRHQQLLLDC